MTANLRRGAGSLLVLGLSGHELTGLERAWLKVVRPAGIILFRRNISDAQQTGALLNDATAICAPHSLRCVDVEGGTVDRLRDALASMPSAQAVAATGKPALMRMQGELVARGVGAFGFNTTLAPVLDLALPACARVMGTRVVSPSADGVIAYARNFLAGLAAHGVAGCGKHFPGLGGGTLDSHETTPAIDRTMRDLWREDIAPYRALAAELPMIMVNHAAYPRTPGKQRPATASPWWIATVLRKRLGYRGIVFSDDMEMGGILKFAPIEDAAIAALRAGMDQLEICHSPELILRAYEALVSEAERSLAFRTLLLERARSAARKRAALFSHGTRPALSQRQFEALRDKIVRFSETVATGHATSSSRLEARALTKAETA